jgi:eukaryotic-like serine/threonine-protein kinase
MAEHVEHSDFSGKMIGPYTVLKSLGKGGMGEVFLVYDSLCERKIALKKILPELMHHPIIKERFLREARFASKLCHPCIIPIHFIQEEGEVYYTMPYIEGETLKEILHATVHKESSGYAPHELGVSIPALTRIFLSVCQAIAYAYSKSILHRDLKPENIIVGKFGEVFLLDWGIATYLDDPHLEELTIEGLEESKEPNNLTKPGKVLGTVNFMAPERALKHPATMQTEIYSLGVMLYQILTLKLPFFRKNLEHFRRIMKFETFTPPEEIAPYRDIPKQLSHIAHKCLAKEAQERYHTIQELIFDLENYIEGRPEWIFTAHLDTTKKQDWEFQENILLSKHLAITRIIDELEWVGLMISNQAFSGNLKLEVELKLPVDSEGIGILMCIPPPSDRQGLEDGYCLWLSGAANPYSVLFRSNVEILSIPDSGIKEGECAHVCIEKIDNTVLIYINGHLRMNYMSHIPLVGAHLGFVYKNTDFEISPIKVSTGSQTVMVNCLSVPDAFLANKHFEKALTEYKRIACSFQGREEGREAQFRAGLTLLEQGKRERHRSIQQGLFSQALAEFEELRNTPGAPLEYLGKALVYYALEELEEERKCLELALRKYPKHPLLSILKEHIVFRLHESSKQDRVSAYLFALLSLRHTQEIFTTQANKRLLDHLVKHWTPLPFIDHDVVFSEKKYEYIHYAIQLAFWLYKPLVLLEIIETFSEDVPEAKTMILNALFALLYMRQIEKVLKLLQEQPAVFSHHQFPPAYPEILIAFLSKSLSLSNLLEHLPKRLGFAEMRLCLYLIERALITTPPQELLLYVEILSSYSMESAEKRSLKQLHIQLLLSSHQIKQAHSLFQSCSFEELHDPHSPFYFLYGCYLWVSEGEAQGLQHLSSASKEPWLYPYAFVSHHITAVYQDCSEHPVFYWEKLELYKKLELFYSIIGQKRAATEFRKKIGKLSPPDQTA